MIHNLDEVPKRTPQPGPAVKLCHLIISECLKSGHPSIRLTGGDLYEGLEVLSVQYLVDGSWTDVMKIPAGPGVAVMARFRSMCDIDPARDPQQGGIFRVSAGGHQASVTAHFRRSADGVEHGELQITSSPLEGAK
jgi:hypothetical protein